MAEEWEVKLVKNPQFKSLPPDRQKAVYQEAKNRFTGIGATQESTEKESGSQGFFESEPSKTLFRAGGQIAGGLKSIPTAMRGAAIGGRLGAPFGPAGAATGAALGGVGGFLLAPTLGALTGEATRQAGQLVETGKPILNQIQQLKRVGAAAIESEAIGAGISGGLKASVPLIKSGTKFFARLFPGISNDAVQRVFERGADRIVRPEFTSDKGSEVPEIIRSKVIQGINAFKDNFQSSFKTSREQIAPVLDRLRIPISAATSRFQRRLAEMRFVEISPSGQPVKIPTFLPKGIARETESDKQLLSGILNNIKSLGRQPIPARRVLDLVDEIDEMVKYDPNQVKRIGEKSALALKELRRGLVTLVSRRVPSLRRANIAYSKSSNLYEAIQPRLKDQTVDSTILAIGKKGNQFAYRILKQIDDSLPPQQKFMDDLLDFDAGRQFFKGSRFLSTPLVSLGGAFGGIAAGGIPGGIGAVGLGALTTTPRVWGEAIKVLQNLTKAGKIPASVARRILPGAITGTSTQEE